MKNKLQQDLLNQLNEYQTQQLDEIPNILKKGISAVGAVPGAIKGAGQKIKGATKRFGQDVAQAYKGGREGAAKKIAGQDYKAPAAKQTPAATGTQQKTPGKFGQAMSNIGRDLKGVAYDGVAGDGYDYKQGVRSQSDPIKTPNATSTPAQATTTPAAGGTQAQKRTKTGGKVAGQVSQTKSAQSQRDRRAAKKAGGSAVSQGISQAQKDAANKGIANMQKQQAGKTATNVPGQKAPVAQVDKNKDGKDDKTGKPISQTAQNVGKNAGVNTAKIGGQKIDLNDPKMKNLRNAIEKASPGTIGAIDKMDAPSKAKLKKAIS